MNPPSTRTFNTKPSSQPNLREQLARVKRKTLKIAREGPLLFKISHQTSSSRGCHTRFWLNNNTKFTDLQFTGSLQLAIEVARRVTSFTVSSSYDAIQSADRNCNWKKSNRKLSVFNSDCTEQTYYLLLLKREEDTMISFQ